MGRDPYPSPNNPSTSPRRKRKIHQNRESMDIDAIMNGSEGSGSSPDLGDQVTNGRSRPYPVSKATKDLISFLEEGPPSNIQPTRTATVSAVSLTPTTKSAKSGNRLQRMISKLNLSKDDRMLQDSRGRGVGTTSAPTTPLVASVRSLGTVPPLPPSVKPVPPVLSIPPSVPLSPPPSSQPSPEDDEARSPASRNDRQPRKMSIRKAVPNWDTADQAAGVTPSPHTVHTSSPSITSPISPTQNGQAQPRLPQTQRPRPRKPMATHMTTTNCLEAILQSKSPPLLPPCLRHPHIPQLPERMRMGGLSTLCRMHPALGRRGRIVVRRMTRRATQPGDSQDVSHNHLLPQLRR
jgi:hypothetical protein